MNLTRAVGLLLFATFQAAEESPVKPRDCAEQTATKVTPKEEQSKPVLAFDRSQLKAADPAKGQPLARVFTDYIYPADLEAKTPMLTEEEADRLSGRVVSALFQKFAEERQLCATDEEIKKYQKALQFDASEDPESEKLTPDEQQELDGLMHQWAEASIIGWKRDRALYERYGGTVIFQQANPLEPVGAYRQFLEETEKLAVFEIYDAGHREQFWRYFVMKHPFQVPVEDIDFGRPWWAKIEAPTTDSETK